MSIGKFFILAILLPMATIYLTLTLKGEDENFVELDVEQALFGESEKVSSIDDDLTPEKSESSFNDKIDEEQEKSLTTNSNIFYIDKAAKSNTSFASIEEIIKFKKNKRKNTEPKNTKPKNNYSSIFNDDEDEIREIKKSHAKDKKDFKNTAIVKKPKTSRNKPKYLTKINNSVVNKTRLKLQKKPKQTAKINKSTINKKRFKVRNEPKKIAKINKLKTVVNSVAPGKNKITPKKLNTTKKFSFIKKQRKKVTKFNKYGIKFKDKKIVKSVKKQKKAAPKTEFSSNSRSARQQKSAPSDLSRFDFGDVFDEDTDIEDEFEDEINVEADSIDTAPLIEKNQETEVVDNGVLPIEKTGVKKQFAANPCSGRSARYIARCRQK